MAPTIPAAGRSGFSFGTSPAPIPWRSSAAIPPAIVSQLREALRVDESIRGLVDERPGEATVVQGAAGIRRDDGLEFAV
jgi:hypothetical protein